MKKIFLLTVFILILCCFIGCQRDNAVLDEVKTYSVSGNIHSLDITINTANFVIKHGESLSVESNLKYLSVTEDNGVLTVKDEAKVNSKFNNATFTIYIPQDKAFESIEIATGAAKITADAITTNSLELKLGAGDVRFKCLNVKSKTEIEGGAGQITILDGEINDLNLIVGYGAFNLTASLLGRSDLKFGVGKSNITLLGGKDNYKLDIVKGAGLIYVDGEDVSENGSIGSGMNKIDILGGVGAVDIIFQ